MNFIISIIVILTLYMIYKYICTPKNLTCEQYFNKKYPHVPTCTIKKCCKIIGNIHSTITPNGVMLFDTDGLSNFKYCPFCGKELFSELILDKLMGD